MVPLDHRGARSITALHVVGEAVLDAGVDVQLANPASEELALDRRDERPDETPPAIRRIDQHVQQARAAFGPRRSCDRESDQGRSVPGRHHDGVRVGRLPPHLARGERARTPLLALELQHPRA
jgi:hypothetical protein